MVSVTLSLLPAHTLLGALASLRVPSGAVLTVTLIHSCGLLPQSLLAVIQTCPPLTVLQSMSRLGVVVVWVVPPGRVQV